MKTCNDCLHYNICKNNNTLCHTSRLTSDSDITERCSDFADRSEWVHLPAERRLYIQNSWRHSKRYHSCQLQKCGERIERMKENGSFETVSVLWNGFVRVPRSNDSTACKNRGISSRQTKKEANHR